MGMLNQQERIGQLAVPLVFEEFLLKRPRGHIFHLAEVFDEEWMHQMKTSGSKRSCSVNQVVGKLQLCAFCLRFGATHPGMEWEVSDGAWTFDEEPTAIL